MECGFFSAEDTERIAQSAAEASAFDIPCSTFDIPLYAGTITSTLQAAWYVDQEQMGSTPMNAEFRLSNPNPLFPFIPYPSSQFPPG